MSLLSRLLRLKRRFERPLDALNLVSVSKSAVLGNYDLLKRLAGDAAVFPVLKSNAYGHGLGLVAKILRDCPEIPYVAVDSAYEALKVHDAHPKARVLLLGYTTPGNLAKLDFSRVTPTVHGAEGVEALSACGKKACVHIELDTGMARQGFSADALPGFLEALKSAPNVELEGVFTHLARADEADFEPTRRQLEKFREMIATVRAAGFSPKWVHVANSPGLPKLAESFQEFGINACRAGLALYGLNPLEVADASFNALAGLKPAMEWSTTLVECRTLKKGESASYGALFTADRDMIVGAVPVGYYEGIPRAATGKWSLSTSDGRVLPILGRVCMNLCVVDLSAAPELKVGDRLTVVSRMPGPHDAYAFAQACGTIPYEAVTGVAESIRRMEVE